MSISPYDNLPVGDAPEYRDVTPAGTPDAADEGLTASDEKPTDADQMSAEPTVRENREAGAAAWEAPEDDSRQAEPAVRESRQAGAAAWKTPEDDSREAEPAVRESWQAGAAAWKAPEDDSRKIPETSLHYEEQAAAGIAGGEAVPMDPPPRYETREINAPMAARRRTQPFRETLLVPDTHPDMDRLLLAEGAVHSGDRIALTVVYRTDAGGISSIRSSIPFASGGGGDIVLGSISAELVNERKFMVSGELLITETELQKQSLRVLEEADGLVLAKGSAAVTHLEGRQRETTHISQDINIREDQPTPAELLSQSIHIVENHRRVTAGKLVINASVHCRVLYRGEEDGEVRLSAITNKTDFTQFILVKDGVDAGLMDISFPVDDLEIRIVEGRLLRLEGDLTSEVAIYRNFALPMVFDAYHRQRDIRFRMERSELTCLRDVVTGEVSAREVVRLDEVGGAGSGAGGAAWNAGGIGTSGGVGSGVDGAAWNADGTGTSGGAGSGAGGAAWGITGAEAGKAIRQFLYASALPHITDITARLDNGRIVIEGAAEAALLGLDEEGQPCLVKTRLPLRGALDAPLTAPALTTNAAPAGSAVSAAATAIIKDLWFDRLDAGRLEINITAAITVRLSAAQVWLSPQDLAFAETDRAEAPPALALRVTGGGDTLWSIAKHYKGDAAAIAALNDLDPGDIHTPLPENLKLLITV